MKKNKLQSQNLLEGILIFALVALGCCAFVSHFDYKLLRNYVFGRPATTSGGSTTITIEAMTK